ncbi:MAG: aminoacetone oxidase family FAD-binding enzyme [Lachnospiraceae bacterium]|nr:aminoacetone oxidase family FAD-binding enzyme [Lachnospiraceae bacterium]
MVVIIGCGASGMLAAIMAARQGVSVTVLEHNDRPGRKLLATGNGKCNLTNDNQSLDNFRSSYREEIKDIIDAFSEEDLLRFFREIGIITKERKGYRYPRSEQASSVVTVLVSEMQRLRVRVICGAEVTKVSGNYSDYEVSYTMDGQKYTLKSENVVFACGGPAGERLGQSNFGIKMLRNMGVLVGHCAPALVPLLLRNPCAKTVSGVRMEADVTLTVGKESYREHGEIVWTDYGVSGIPVMQLSRYATFELEDDMIPVRIAFHFLPEMTDEEITGELTRRVNGEAFRTRSAEDAMEGLVPKKLLYVLLKGAGIDPEAPAGTITEKQLKLLKLQLTNKEFTVTGTRPWEFAQVMKGGVPLSAIDTKTCEVRGHEGLYITGELLDMDGNCGGYNLHWAFATGAVCGRALAKKSRSVE